MTRMTVPESATSARLAALVALVAIYLAATAAVLLRPEGGVAVWWPAAGLAIGLTALSPRAWWPWLFSGIWLITAAANVSGGRDLDLAVLF